MKRAILLSLLSFFWLSACAQIAQKKANEKFARQWSPILSLLNQDPEYNKKEIDRLADDLLQIYDDELSFIEELWKKKTSPHLPHDPIDKNEFFYDEINKLNNNELKKLRFHDDINAPLLKNYFEIASHIIEAIESNPSFSSKNVFDYKEGYQIGFCFGRALLTHYLLLRAGVLQQNIKKVFALGDLLVGGQFWRFHVAVMVKDNNGEFLVVDPLMGEPASLQTWMAAISNLEIKKPLSLARFYVADPRKFMPSTGRYEIASLKKPELELYFSHLGATLFLSTRRKNQDLELLR